MCFLRQESQRQETEQSSVATEVTAGGFPLYQGRRWQEHRPEQRSLFPSPSELNTNFAVSQQAKERAKTKRSFSQAVPHFAFAAGKESITPSTLPKPSCTQRCSTPCDTQKKGVTLHLWLCKQELVGSVSSSTEGGEQQGKPPLRQFREFWLYGPVQLLQLLCKKQKKSCKRHLAVQEAQTQKLLTKQEATVK